MTEPTDLRVVGAEPEFTDVGKLEVDRGDWLRRGCEIAARRGEVQWQLGDWACAADRSWGDLASAAPEIGVPARTLYNYASVARRVEVYRRRETLSFGHHEAVAALSPETGDQILDLAEAEGWPCEQTREAARDASTEARLRARIAALETKLARAEADARIAHDVSGRLERRLRLSARQLPQTYREFAAIVRETAAAPELEALHGNARNALAGRFQKIIDDAADACTAIAKKQLREAFTALAAPSAGVEAE